MRPSRIFISSLTLWHLDRSSGKIVRWNQTSNYMISVETKGWSNYFTEGGGCVTCPYTCIKPQIAPNGGRINATNTTMMDSLPSIYTQTKANGCCYASPSESKVMPDCAKEANPPEAEACGFLSGPTLKWRIGDAARPANKSVVRTSNVHCIVNLYDFCNSEFRMQYCLRQLIVRVFGQSDTNRFDM